MVEMTLEQKEVKRIPHLRFSEFKGGFKQERLDCLFSIFNGYAFSSDDAQESGCRWVKIADVGINKMNLDTPSFLPIEYRGKYKNFVLQEGDYVVALTRPILNGELKIARINKVFTGALLNQRVGKLTTQNSIEFVNFMLQRSSLLSRIENRIAGTDPPNLSPFEIGSIITYFPSLPEQKKIASFLSAIDKKIHQLTRKKELLEQYKKGVMQKIFSQEIRFKQEDGSDYPEWEEKRLGELDIFISDGNYGEQYPKASELKYSGIPFIRANNIKNLKLIWDDMKFIDLELHNTLTTGHLKMHDILVTTRGDIGTVAYVTEEFKGSNINAQICLLRVGKSVNSYYLLQLLASDNGVKQFKKFQTGSALKQLPKKSLNAIKLLLPSLKEQKQIATLLTKFDKKIESLQIQIDKTQQFKKGLLQQMFV